MNIKEKLFYVVEGILVLYMILEAGLAGGAHYLAETGRHLDGWFYEEIPSIGLGIVSPLSAALVAFKLLTTWEDLPKLRWMLLAMWGYWFVAWIPFIGTYFLAHSNDPQLTYQQVYQLYFSEESFRTVTVIGILSIVSANTIMIPALLASMLGDVVVRQKLEEKEVAKQKELSTKQREKQRKQFLRQAGLWPQRIMEYLHTATEGVSVLQLCAVLPGEPDRQKIYPHLRKLEEMELVYSIQGEGKEKIYYANVEI